MVTRYDIETTLRGIHGINWELSIFQHYSGQPIEPNVNILSPLRDNDTSPSMRIFRVEDGTYLAYDYATELTYNIFKFVHAFYCNKDKVEYEFSISQSCEWINTDMGLGLGGDVFDIVIPSDSLGISDRVFKKRELPQVSIYPNRFGGVDRNYWGQYFITEEWLNFFEIYVIYKMYWSYDKGFVWKEKYTYKQTDPAYYYRLIDDNGQECCKVLRPYNKDFKWYTTVSKHDMNSIQGFRQADLTQETVFLTSSLKDVIILRMLGYTAYALNSESCNISEEFLTHLKTYHKEVIVFYDNDAAGKRATAKVLEVDPIFTRGVFIPNGMFFSNTEKEVSDPSDFIKYTGGDFQRLNNLISYNHAKV